MQTTNTTKTTTFIEIAKYDELRRIPNPEDGDKIIAIFKDGHEVQCTRKGSYVLITAQGKQEEKYIHPSEKTFHLANAIEYMYLKGEFGALIKHNLVPEEQAVLDTFTAHLPEGETIQLGVIHSVQNPEPMLLKLLSDVLKESSFEGDLVIKANSSDHPVYRNWAITFRDGRVDKSQLLDPYQHLEWVKTCIDSYIYYDLCLEGPTTNVIKRRIGEIDKGAYIMSASIKELGGDWEQTFPEGTLHVL